MINKRVTFNEYNEPVVTITVTAWHDVVRLNEHLKRGQVEFVALARRVDGSLARKVGAKRFRQLQDHVTGKVPWR